MNTKVVKAIVENSGTSAGLRTNFFSITPYSGIDALDVIEQFSDDISTGMDQQTQEPLVEFRVPLSELHSI